VYSAALVEFSLESHVGELPHKTGAHARKHGRKGSCLEVYGDEAKIVFSPAVLEAMQELHARALAHGHERFDDDAAHILKDMAYGKPMSVGTTLSALVTVCRIAENCYAATGDRHLDEALHAVQTALNGLDGNALPTTTVNLKLKTRGR
jgi:hypothetical protein